MFLIRRFIKCVYDQLRIKFTITIFGIILWSLLVNVLSHLTYFVHKILSIINSQTTLIPWFFNAYPKYHTLSACDSGRLCKNYTEQYRRLFWRVVSEMTFIIVGILLKLFMCRTCGKSVWTEYVNDLGTVFPNICLANILFNVLFGIWTF